MMVRSLIQAASNQDKDHLRTTNSSTPKFSQPRPPDVMPWSTKELFPTTKETNADTRII